MKIIYYDGSILTCSIIWIEDNNLIADDIYIIPLYEVLRIEEATV